jgi:hypothetical protein
MLANGCISGATRGGAVGSRAPSRLPNLCFSKNNFATPDASGSYDQFVGASGILAKVDIAVILDEYNLGGSA